MADLSSHNERELGGSDDIGPAAVVMALGGFWVLLAFMIWLMFG